MTASAFRCAVAAELALGPAWARSFQDVKRTVEAMVADGEVVRIAPPGGRFRNMLALSRTGASRYYPGIPDIPVVRSPAEECDEIAERVAEGESLASAARALGISYFVAQRRWADICAGLGRQAA